MRYIKRFKMLRAYFFTLKILLKYFFLFILKKPLPNKVYSRLLKKFNLRVSYKVRNYFIRLQGIYVKLGQFLSVIGNVFAPELTFYLKDLQDKVPSKPFALFLPVFLENWGAEPQHILDSFDPHPVASASLGQVYQGVYQGQKVAIKVLYPDMENVLQQDLKILKSLLNLIKVFFSSLNTSSLFTEFSDMLLKEIDYNYEKKHIQKLKAQFVSQEFVIIPDYIDNISSKNILVTQFIEGCKIDDISCLKAMGHDPLIIAQNLVHAYSKMIFKHGFFHSDPHPGNLIITPQGKIGIIDFGAADTLSYDALFMIRKILKAFLFKDHAMIVQHFEEIGFVKPDSDKEEIEKIVYFTLQKLSAFQVKDYQNMTLNQIYKIYNTKEVGMPLRLLIKQLQIPQNYLFLGRTLAILVGVAGKLDPHLNLIQIMLPYLKKFLIDKKENLKAVVKEELRLNYHYLSNLPHNVHKFLENINSGKVKINLKGMQPTFKKLYVLGHQLIYALLLIATLAFSLQCRFNNEYRLSQIFAYISGFFGVVLFFSFLKQRKK